MTDNFQLSANLLLAWSTYLLGTASQSGRLLTS